jgi:cytochrome b6-f complex iron-sulfur subunit
MKTLPTLSRRNFIRLLLWAAGMLGLGGLVRFFSYEPQTGQATRFEMGDLADFPPGSRTVRMDVPAVIYNEDAKISAYHLICTHLGCRVEEDGVNFGCPCHGSQFDRDGKVLHGPAQRSLQAMKVEITEDRRLILETQK